MVDDPREITKNVRATLRLVAILSFSTFLSSLFLAQHFAPLSLLSRITLVLSWVYLALPLYLGSRFDRAHFAADTEVALRDTRWVRWCEMSFATGVLILALLAFFLLATKPIVRPPNGPTLSTETHDVVAGVIALNALYAIVGMLAIAGGIYLASRASPPVRAAGVIVTLGGALSLTAALSKDFKLFGSLVEKIQIVLGHSTPPPVLKMNSAARACIVGPFGDGDAHIPPPPRITGGVSDLAQRASGCAQKVTTGPHGAKLLQITLIGHVDMRELGRRSSREYGSNFNLAYQRALALLPFVEAASPGDSLDGSRARITLLVAGSENVGPNLSDAQLAADRSVEIRTVWVSLASSRSADPPSP